MNRHQLVLRYLLAVGLILLAGSIIYFSYSVIYTVNRIPQIITQIESTSESINRATDGIDRIADHIPVIVEQVDKVQQRIPLILNEVEASRRLVPGILEEVEQVRLQIPSIINEMQAIRQDLPAVLEEAKAIRQMVPTTLDRADKLVGEVKNAGRKASEGAVTGVFTGIIKAPFSWMGNIGKSLFPKTNISADDQNKIKDAIEKALNAEVASTHRWNNTDTGTSGEVQVLAEELKEDSICRKLRVLFSRRSKQIGNREINLCRTETGGWQLISDKN